MDSRQMADPAVVSAARWFWWIAGLSLVNTVMLYTEAGGQFVIGLGLTTLASVMLGQTMAFAVIAATLAFYVWIGHVAAQGRAWAFHAGLAVYAIDALLFVYLEDWMSVAFHALAIFFIVKGLVRLRETARPAT